MDGDPLASGAFAGRRAKDVRANEKPSFRPPESDLLPLPRVHHDDELEGCIIDRPDRLYMKRQVETLRETATIAVVPVEELDDAAWLSGRPNPLLPKTRGAFTNVDRRP